MSILWQEWLLALSLLLTNDPFYFLVVGKTLSVSRWTCDIFWIKNNSEIPNEQTDRHHSYSQETREFVFYWVQPNPCHSMMISSFRYIQYNYLHFDTQRRQAKQIDMKCQRLVIAILRWFALKKPLKQSICLVWLRAVHASDLWNLPL